MIALYDFIKCSQVKMKKTQIVLHLYKDTINGLLLEF